MTGRISLRGWPTVSCAVLAVVLLLQETGSLDRLSYLAADVRSRVLNHEVPSNIVIVGIDARSIGELNQWPWPRRHHAALLDKLQAVSPARVFFDVDFSSPSQPEDDSRFAKALAEWRGPPVILPLLFQQSSGADSEITVTQPLPQFGTHAARAAVNLLPSSDGKVREMFGAWQLADGQAYPTIVGLDARTPPAGTAMAIDYAIAPSSFNYLSYSDLLSGRILAADLKDKSIYIGAFAIELGDMVPVPVHGRLPGVVVQALAAQTLAEGLLVEPPKVLALFALALWTAACGALHSRRAWRGSFAVLAAGAVLLFAVALLSYAHLRIALDVVPFVTASTLVFATLTLRTLDEQTWRALAASLGIRRRDALISSIVDSSMDCILCVDGSGRIQTANAAAANMFRCDSADLLGKELGSFIPALGPGSLCSQGEALRAAAGSATESSATTTQGTAVPIEFTVSPIDFKEDRLYTVILRDITERRAQQRELEYRATHDPLTTLPNRAALSSHLDHTLATTRNGSSAGLMMLDLCRFKEVNDTLGHNTGDLVLREVARRFDAVVGGNGFLARIGGDEFTVVIKEVSSIREASSLAQALSDSLNKPIDAGGVAIDVGLSVGIALYPQNAADGETLLRHADVAMYAAKHRGSVYEFYDSEHDRHSVRRLTMVTELRTAIATDQIDLYYQPQIDLRTGLVSGVEALVRWQHPVLGPVSPAEFVAVAESTDLIPLLTEWTLRRALRQMSTWSGMGRQIRMAVNLSARILQDVTFPARLSDLLVQEGVSPGRLEIEITESAMMIDPERALAVVKEIHSLGVLIAIDDYGTGFSSLSYLRDLPVHVLKLDKSFVMDLADSLDNRVIAASTVQMAHALGLKVIAEGIETAWIADHLCAAGYDYGQGYHYSPALPADKALEWIAEFEAQQESRSTRIGANTRLEAPKRAGRVA